MKRITTVDIRAAALPIVAALVLAGSARGECPQSPILGSVDTDDALDVAVAGDVAYVSDGDSGLQVIDVSDPLNPAILGFVDTPSSFAQGVAVAGDVAYVADASSGLQVIDVSDPASPAIIGFVDTPGNANRVAVAGDVAYVGDNQSGLQVIDVSDPLNPAILGFVDTPDFAVGVAVAGDVAYVADGSSGLQVIDVSDPANPAILGFVDTPGFAHGVAVAGDVAYVADSTFGLQVIDVSDPASPAILGFVDTPSQAADVAVAGDVAYVADRSSGLQVIDVSDPANPAILGFVDTPGIAHGVAVAGDVAYVADRFSGLQAIDVSGCVLTPPNDLCANAIPIGEGDTTFTNVNATTDGPTLPLGCAEYGELGFGADIWFTYTPERTGRVTISTCGQADFDTRLAAYAGACDNLLIGACNDDAPGCGQGSEMTISTMTASETTLIRVGGYQAPTGLVSTGSGTLTITLDPCADFNGDGSVGFTDLSRLLAFWGECPGCEYDLNEDERVGFADLTALLNAWGPC